MLLSDASRASRALWALLVVVLFGLPLFANLRGTDLRGDEAAHSFAVDRILETGDWLIPRNSPSDNPFVEKPPLKFWIVAAPMRAGLMPQTEFGMRVWDALFGTIAFFYVFRIGCRLAGPVCGSTAVLILFVHWPLLFEHGIRSNNMEAALLLCYCGGFHHYLSWTSTEKSGERWGHAVAVGLYFVLGFMVKFVAALFLPFVIFITSLTIGRYRSRLVADWRIWSVSILAVLLLVTPWFAYGYHVFGQGFWHIILEEHVYKRLTVGLDPTHLHPWNYYFTQLSDNLMLSRTWALCTAGGALLLADTLRKRWSEGFLVLLWFAVPIGAMSLGSSKLYHYAYPLVPAVALAGGYLLGSAWQRLQPVVRQWFTHSNLPWLGAEGQPQPRPYQRALIGLAIVASGVIVWTTIFGLVRIGAKDAEVFKSSGFLRPWIVAVVCLVLAGRGRDVGRYLIVPVFILWMLPSLTYREVLQRIAVQDHPYRSVSECIATERRTAGGDPLAHNLYVAGPDSAFGHHHTYYFRKLGSIERAITPSEERIQQYIDGPNPEPVLVDASWYRAHLSTTVDPPVKTIQLEDALVLLPGTYGECADKF